MKARRVAQQVRLSNIVRDALRLRTEREGVTLAEVHDKALKWFLKHMGRKKAIFYIASSHEGGYVTMWLDGKLLGRIQEVAKRDSVSVNRVTYTALVLYLQSLKLV